jgi:hypothetical protein
LLDAQKYQKTLLYVKPKWKLSLMSNEVETLNMVKCPYCTKEWVRDETELVCKDCEPDLGVDLAVADIVNAINVLKNSNSEKIKERIELLTSLHQILTSVIKKALDK